MPHCQYVFAQENVPKDTYYDLNRNASSACINKLFTDNSLLHLTAQFPLTATSISMKQSVKKCAGKNFSSFLGMLNHSKKWTIYDKTNATVCMITFLRQLTDIYCTVRKNKN